MSDWSKKEVDKALTRTLLESHPVVRDPRDEEIEQLQAENERIRAERDDAVSGLRYIYTHHGALSGVGWERVLPELRSLNDE